MNRTVPSICLLLITLAGFALFLVPADGFAGEPTPPGGSPDEEKPGKDAPPPKAEGPEEKPSKGEGETEGTAGEKPPKGAEEKPAEGGEKPPKTAPKEGESKGEEAAPGAETSPEKALEATRKSARELAEDKLASLILRAPLSGGRNSFFHSLLHIPPIRGAYALPSESGRISLAFEMSGSNGGRQGTNRFEATHFESDLDLSYALTDLVEFHGTLCTALLGGDVDLEWRGQPMVPSDRDERLRLSRLVLGTKFNLLPLGDGAPDIWASLDFKIQATDKDLADSGRPGVAFAFLVSQPLGPIWAHFNFGWSITDGQEAFPSVVNTMTGQAESVPVDRIFFWGLSLVWPIHKSFSISLQGLGHTNGFRDLSVLNSDVHVITVGGRFLYRKVFAELVLGGGATESSLDYLVRLEIGMIL